MQTCTGWASEPDVNPGPKAVDAPNKEPGVKSNDVLKDNPEIVEPEPDVNPKPATSDAPKKVPPNKEPDSKSNDVRV
jgi:hypothetical protein